MFICNVCIPVCALYIYVSVFVYYTRMGMFVHVCICAHVCVGAHVCVWACTLCTHTDHLEKHSTASSLSVGVYSNPSIQGLHLLPYASNIPTSGPLEPSRRPLLQPYEDRYFTANPLVSYFSRGPRWLANLWWRNWAAGCL